MTSSAARSVPYARLPCWKIYPGGGMIYIADHVHKQRPKYRGRSSTLPRSVGCRSCFTAAVCPGNPIPRPNRDAAGS